MAKGRSKAFKTGATVAKRRTADQKKSRSIRTFNLEDEAYEKFKKICAEEGQKMSAVVDDLIKGFISDE